MKKITASILAAILIFCMCGCSHAENKDGLIKKARKEINLAEADSIELVIAGESVMDDRHLFWFVSGNEYQAHSYFPMEFTKLENGKYSFVKDYNALKRGTDIFVIMWHDSYSFMVNNPKCKSISITGYKGEEIIPVEEIPFVYHYPFFQGEYYFLDGDGKEVY